MHYRNLGRAGLKVSEICLGTMTFGGDENAGNRVRQRQVNFFPGDESFCCSAGKCQFCAALAMRCVKTVAAIDANRAQRPCDAGKTAPTAKATGPPARPLGRCSLLLER